MPPIEVGRLKFDFPAGWRAAKVDDWSFYRNQFIRISDGTKAIDLLAIDAAGGCAWNIEVKDYRKHRRTKAIDIAEEVADKVRCSLAAIYATAVNANDSIEKSVARAALKCVRLRVVLHLEQPAKHSTLFPRAIKPEDVTQRLRQLVKAIDPHPLVVELNQTGGVAWTVTSV